METVKFDIGMEVVRNLSNVYICNFSLRYGSWMMYEYQLALHSCSPIFYSAWSLTGLNQ